MTKFEKVFLNISGILLAILALSVFYEVVSRYVFNNPTIWANEISIYLMQFIVFFTMGILLIEGKHIRVTFLIERLTGNARKAFEIIIVLLIFIFALVLIIYGYQFTGNAISHGMSSPTLLEIPLWIPYSFIPIGGFLLALATTCSIIKILATSYDKEDIM
ncbi:TRAP transporter small permease [Virgibacillus byunsanensis]|uniref:TRAP transporter small permease n=1 Tax=Virgibacillus byunsanensis TaxID=570945 RepID=A0ABW3LK85_9BACI